MCHFEQCQHFCYPFPPNLHILSVRGDIPHCILVNGHSYLTWRCLCWDQRWLERTCWNILYIGCFGLLGYMIKVKSPEQQHAAWFLSLKPKCRARKHGTMYFNKVSPVKSMINGPSRKGGGNQIHILNILPNFMKIDGSHPNGTDMSPNPDVALSSG